MDGERPNYAFMSAYNQDHAYPQARLAEKSFKLSFANTSTSLSAISNPSLNQPVKEPAHNFNLSTSVKELNHYIEDICLSMLSKPDGSEFTLLIDTLLCLTDNEWQYLPLWAGGNDDGSGGVTSADVSPAYYANVGGLTPAVQYKGVAGFVGVGSSINTSLDVGDGSNRTVTVAGSEAGSDVGKSYDMAVVTPTGSGSESDFEIVSEGEDEESGDDFTVSGDSISESELSDGEIVYQDKGKGKGKEKEYEEEEEDDMGWTDQEDLEDDWEGSFTDA
ncbi:hypothetical protein EAF04_004772 [Stromatinia cepivora]|nr:hypothetical protein EAF04_004772 [Stromatinia cepivora]